VPRIGDDVYDDDDDDDGGGCSSDDDAYDDDDGAEPSDDGGWSNDDDASDDDVLQNVSFGRRRIYGASLVACPTVTLSPAVLPPPPAATAPHPHRPTLMRLGERLRSLRA